MNNNVIFGTVKLLSFPIAISYDAGHGNTGITPDNFFCSDACAVESAGEAESGQDGFYLVDVSLLGEHYDADYV